VNESGVTPVGDMMNGRIMILSCFYVCFMSIASGVYLSIFSCSLVFMFVSLGIAMSIK